MDGVLNNACAKAWYSRLLLGCSLTLLVGCSSLKYVGHEHDGPELHLECPACAQAVQGITVETIRQLNRSRNNNQGIAPESSR